MDHSMAFNTFEGLYALEECISQLRKRKPTYPLRFKKELNLACKDHIADIGPQGLYGHASSWGLSVFDRIRNYLPDQAPGMLAECLGYGSSNSIEALILLLIDDGDPNSRTQRSHLLDPNHKIVGYA